MERVAISVYVPEKLAVAAGKTTFGETLFHPTEHQLAELSTQERTFVASRYVGLSADHSLVLDTAEPSWADVARLIRSEISKRSETERQRREATEEAKAAAKAQNERSLLEWGLAHFPEEVALVQREGDSVIPYLGYLIAKLVKDLLEKVWDPVARYTVGTKPFSMIKLRRRTTPRMEAVQLKINVEDSMKGIPLPPSCSYDVAVERLDTKPGNSGGYSMHLTVVTVRLQHPLWPEKIFVLPTERVERWSQDAP